MIIGNGMVAHEFKNYNNDDKVIIFASGVSKSNETSTIAFNREKNLLLSTINTFKGKILVYFSTCSIYDTYAEYNLYTKHKLAMEHLISQSNIEYLIFRLPQVVGNNNKSQLMGFLYEKIINKQKFTLFNIERNLIDISDVYKIVNYIIDNNLFKNKIINIANIKNIKVLKLVKKIEKLVSLKADYELVSKDGSLKIDISDINLIIKKFDFFDACYIEKLLRKYYG